MKPSLRVITALAATLATGTMAYALQPATGAAASTATPAATAPAGPSKVAIIAFQAAVAQTNEGQQDFADVQKKFTPQQTQLKAQAAEIDTLKKKLQTDGSTLSQEERATRLKAIDSKEKELQKTAQTAQGAFQKEMGDAYQKIAQKFYSVLHDFCTKNGYTVVLDISAQQSPVVYADPSADITPAVIAAYNVKSGVPAPAKAAASKSDATPDAPASK